MLDKVGLQMRVGPLDGDPMPCELEEMNENGARIRMVLPHSLPETSAVGLWLDEEDGCGLVVPAYSGWPEVDGDTSVVDLYFAQPNALQGNAQGKKDRRRAIRVRPRDGEVEVWLHTDRAGVAGPVACEIIDLSAGGMCVEIDPAREPTTPFTGATFQVLLPGETWPLMIAAQVRHRRRLARDRVRYGLEFDRRRTEAFDDQQQRIAAWAADHLAQVTTNATNSA